MSWLEKLLPPKIQQTDPADRRQVPEGLWIKCPSCDSVLYKTDLEQNLTVCPTCGHHHRIGARARLNSFLGGCLGSAVGERFVRGVETAIEQKVPFLCFTATGGARMQEGRLSLMQMAKTNAALTRLAKKGLPYISVLTDPTMGGVSAGFAFMGDIVVAEPKALLGFAGPRVIESPVRVTLPEGFQRAEFLQQKGGVDFICDRRELRKTVSHALAMLQRQAADAVS